MFTGLTLTRDAATGMYSYATGGYWPADGLKGGVTNAQGHSSYFTTALSVRSPSQLFRDLMVHTRPAAACAAFLWDAYGQENSADTTR